MGLRTLFQSRREFECHLPKSEQGSNEANDDGRHAQALEPVDAFTGLVSCVLVVHVPYVYFCRCQFSTRWTFPRDFKLLAFFLKNPMVEGRRAD